MIDGITRPVPGWRETVMPILRELVTRGRAKFRLHTHDHGTGSWMVEWDIMAGPGIEKMLRDNGIYTRRRDSEHFYAWIESDMFTHKFRPGGGDADAWIAAEEESEGEAEEAETEAAEEDRLPEAENVPD